MLPLLAVHGQAVTEAPWEEMVYLKFNGDFSDTAARHSPDNYGGAISYVQAVEGGSMHVNQSGRVFCDPYNTDSPDFDFATRDFRVGCDILPTSVGNDYVWMKAPGGNFGVTLKLGVSGPDVIAYLRGVGNVDLSIGAIIPDALVSWHNILVERSGDIWTLYVDSVPAASYTWSEASQPTSGTGYNGFLVGGGVNDNRYSGYIDNFRVWRR